MLTRKLNWSTSLSLTPLYYCVAIVTCLLLLNVAAVRAFCVVEFANTCQALALGDYNLENPLEDSKQGDHGADNAFSWYLQTNDEVFHLHIANLVNFKKHTLTLTAPRSPPNGLSYLPLFPVINHPEIKSDPRKLKKSKLTYPLIKTADFIR